MQAVNLLYHELPDHLTVHGIAYPVKTCWRDWVQLLCTLDDPNATQQDLLRCCEALFTADRPADAAAAVEAITAFAQCADTAKPVQAQNTAQTGSAPVCFSFYYDAAYVLAAFRQVYHIDLRSSDLHWYEFFALFQGLPADTALAQRIALRQMDPSEIQDSGRRRKISLAKASVALPQRELCEEEMALAFVDDDL